MTSFALTQRRRAGAGLIAIGALLLALSAFMLVGLAPSAGANHDGALPNDNSFPPLAECGTQANRAGGWKIGINDGTWVASGIETHGVASGDVTYSITSPTASHTVINPAQAGAANPAQYFNYNYTGSGFQLQVVFLKIASSGEAYLTSTNPGSVLLPSGISHITLCFSVATTTTTVADTTTTTVGGVDEATTTTAGSTTTVAGPGDPELPDTGPGELLALLAGGLGLTFVGSGSLVIASDRRRAR